MSPLDKRKAELEADPDFKKYVRSHKMKIPLVSIRQKMVIEGKFDQDDILMWATAGEIATLKKNK